VGIGGGNVFYKISLLGLMQGEYDKMGTRFPRLIAVVMRKYPLQCVLLAGPSCSGMRLGRGVNITHISGDG
jgi:hypothetical protein